MRGLAVGLALALASGGAFAEEPSFESLGQAPIIGGDRVRARERALDEAMRQAVEQATATVLEPDALVARASELRLRIYPKARSYVVNYHVLEEGEVAATGGVPAFQVHLSAQVSTGRLARDLAQGGASSPSGAGSPKARAIVCQQASTTTTPSGVMTVPPHAGDQPVRELLGARGVELAAPPATCTEEAAAQAARAAGAQGAIVATVEILPAGAIRGSDRMAAHARTRLRLIEPDGRISADAEGERDAYDATVEKAGLTAAREAADEALRALQPAVAARWPTSAPAGGVRVRLGGFTRYADYVAVTRALAALPGVAAVEPRRFGRGEAELLVRTASGAPQLAEGLRRVPPQGVRVTTTAAGADLLDVRVSGEVEHE